ncbi:MAG TPA: recombination mediator RecR [Alphaproteobacteria bacterium]|nr:recombination mediator RecR [Alphaproteobacteria bacterium]
MWSGEIERVIQLFSKLPSLGPRSGRRVALHLLKKKDQVLTPLIDALIQARDTIKTCEICHGFDTKSPCSVCTNPKRNPHTLCIVEDVSDAWALERSHVFKGHYHVLGGVLSAIEGIGPKQLTLDSLINRLKTKDITEVVFALRATLDGQTTMHYISDLLHPFNVKISSLAQGVPVGSDLDYLDDTTLALAFEGRRQLGFH